MELHRTHMTQVGPLQLINTLLTFSYLPMFLFIPLIYTSILTFLNLLYAYGCCHQLKWIYLDLFMLNSLDCTNRFINSVTLKWHWWAFHYYLVWPSGVWVNFGVWEIRLYTFQITDINQELIYFESVNLKQCNFVLPACS